MAGVAKDRVGASSSLLHGALFIGMAALLAILPSIGFYPFVLAEILCFALFACAFNMMVGFGGLLSFGHAMFFGFASYVTAHTAKNGLSSLPFWLPAAGWFDIPFGLPPFSPELAILTGAAVAALLGFIAGSLAIRRQGIYFAMITLALAQMIYFFSLQAPFTGGENGIQAVPRGSAFGIIALSSDWSMSGEVILMTLVGGMGTIFGPVVGAAIIIAIQNYFSNLGAWVTIVQGTIFVICVLLFREGIVGVLARSLKRPL
ncbi:MAG: branched-chain amino acid ABC transporter permease [Rhodomicrobium sp.]|nr:branched-chain amino acid ABC transporter permease [Rhodomicrobium sp.]